MVATHLPEQAAHRLAQSGGFSGFWVGDRPFVHWLADDLAKQARSALPDLPAGRDNRRPLQEVISRRLWRWGEERHFAWERLTPAPPRYGVDSESILAVLDGRMLFATEVATRLRQGNLLREHEEALTELAVAGEVLSFPAVEIRHFGRAVCRRCGETELEREDCWYCGRPSCWVCPTCRHFGAATGCRTLFARAAVTRRAAVSPQEPAWSFSLTTAQNRAIARLCDFLSPRGTGDFLIWAVCGAGKTEVVLSGLAGPLAAGDRVLLATPRRDVAADLAARTAAAFPGISLAVHHGGRHEQGEPDPAVTVATTHQCLRFYQAFDLVILDEVDAFPYHGNRMLYAAMERARRPEARTVYLTATPPPFLLRRIAEGTLPYVRLPVRPHGHPLPVPELIRADLGSPEPGWRPPSALANLLGTRNGRPCLIFVPTVELAVVMGRALAGWGREAGIRVASIHAADEAREEKRLMFVRGELDLLVTTTLLERGLTLGNLDVCVLQADHEAVFDTACLVQIAGRAGRRAEDPRGRVFFVAPRISSPMKAARAMIVAANQEAAAEGYFAPGTD